MKFNPECEHHHRLTTFVGDPHLSKKTIGKVNAVCKQVEALGNQVIWLGDMLNNKEVISGISLNFWLDYFNSSKLDHVVLIGNHDLFSVKGGDHALRALKELPNVIIADKPSYYDANFFLLPYIHDEAEVRRELKKISHPEDICLVTHLPVDGFDYGTGLFHRGGLQLKDLASFRKTIFGHFHKYQKGLYLGTPYSQSFGESDQEKYIGVYNSVTNDLELVKTNLPQHRTIEVDCADYQTDFNLKPKDIYRFILKGSLASIQAFPKAEVQSTHETHIAFLERPTERETLLSNVKETDSPEVQFSVWANEVEGFEEDTIKLGLEILESQRDK